MSAPPGLRIAEVRAADRAAWEPLWRGYQAFYRVDILPQVSEQSWARMLDAREPVRAALAWQADEAVGLVHFIRHRSTWTAGDYCYLQDLFVAPAARRGGVGRRLIEYVVEQAEQAGCERVYWLTHESNAEAMRLYDQVAQRSGFLQYRRKLPR